MAAMNSSYDPPLALTIVSSVSIGFGGLAAFIIAFDIIWRRDWKSMMAIMIPVYIINALYLWPITLWTYLKYSRPQHARRKPSKSAHAALHPEGEMEHAHCSSNGAIDVPHESSSAPNVRDEESRDQEAVKGEHQHHCYDGGSARPMFATVTVAVCHCGAGCVLGDIIGEWIVHGTAVTVNGRSLWPAYLIDFAFAIVLGIVFQYFSIAPMTGDYGPKILWRAAKADFLSLLFFEIGLFGWMAIFQIAIFQWKLEMDTVTYWWMMQIGMFFGHCTGVPINWWLIKTKVEEPCAFRHLSREAYCVYPMCYTPRFQPQSGRFVFWNG